MIVARCMFGGCLYSEGVYARKARKGHSLLYFRISYPLATLMHPRIVVAPQQLRQTLVPFRWKTIKT